jgi:hypothetical protein
MFSQVPKPRRSISTPAMRSDRPTKNNLDSSAISPSLQTQRHLTPILPRHPSAPPLTAPAPRRPHPASPIAGADTYLHTRLIPSLPPHLRALNRESSLTLATGLPAGVEDDGPWSHAVWLAPGWSLPEIYWPWEPLLIHDIKDRICPFAVTGCLQGRPHARAPAHRRHLRGVCRQSSKVLHSFLCISSFHAYPLQLPPPRAFRLKP